MKKINKTFILDLSKRAKLRFTIGVAFFHALAMPINAIAQWEGLENQYGHAVYQYNGNHLDVNVLTNKLIANAKSLSIASHESVSVNQLLASNVALFRSIGPSATKIFGSLTSNGSLFLINQNGVLFGEGAQVNVGGLVASTMNINNDDFLSGNYKFNANGSTGSVFNQGAIKVADGGYLVMLANQVKNEGTLVANNGNVVLASADSATLDFYGNGLVKATLSGDALSAVVAQSGTIQADGGAVQLATNSRSSSVNVSGLVQANSIVERNGIIRLEGGANSQISISGTLRVAGEQAGTTGGHVEVTGEQVALLSGAKLDASGNAGGGEVLIGGAFQGNNAQVYNARTTYVDQNAEISVDAIETGEGGKVIVWADQVTRYYGNISAAGGAVSGNGGFVEVSGKQVLDFIGAVDVSSAYGLGGKVLLDPDNIILNNTAQTSPTNNADNTADIAFTDLPMTDTVIQISDITGFSELFLQAENDITVANNISMVTDNSIRLEANNNIKVNGQVYTRGSGNITLTADADNSGAGDLLLNQRLISREGNITLSGANVSGSGQVLTQGLGVQNSGNVVINATQDINLTNASSIVTNGRNGAAGLKGTNAGGVTLTAGGKINTGNIASSGGRGGTGDTAGGNAGAVNIASIGVGGIATGSITARNGQARGAGSGGEASSITINSATGNINTKTLNVSGNANGNGGNIDIDATAGDIVVTGVAYAQGGTTAAGSTADGGNGGNLDLDASGDVTVTSRVYAQGGGVRSGNTAAGGDGGNVNVTANNLNFGNVIYSYGNNGRGLNQAGGNAGNINLNAKGAIQATNIYSYGGSGGTGAGSNAAGGNAGNINIASTGAGDIATSNVNARNGAARGAGVGGIVGSIDISNTSGDIATRNLDAYGNLNGNGGIINVDASAGDVTVVGRVYSYGGAVNNGHTLAGRNGGNIAISGVNRTVTNRINASGNTAKGINQTGGNAGVVSVTGSGALNVKDVYSRTGSATGVGAGGSTGGITLTGASITATSNIVSAGNRNGAGSNIDLTATSGDINIKTLQAQGGGANTNVLGSDAGNITVNAAGNVAATVIYTQGSSGNGADNNGGNAGSIDVNAGSGITATRVYAYGGNGGGNALTNMAAGGDAGSVNLNSTGAGDIVLTQDINVRTGYSRGSAPGAAVGNINIKNLAGNITTKNVRADGQNHGNGGNVTLDAGATGDVNVNGVIYTYGDRDATAATFVGTSAGNIAIKAKNVTVTGTINTNGGRGRGANQDGGNAGGVNIDATSATSTQAIVASGGNGGNGAGSSSNGGTAGNVTIASTGAGDVTTTNITARTGYARGTGTGNAGSVDIQNSNGSITTANINTRGQRRGAGGDVKVVATGGDINVGTVDARASNIPAIDGGGVTLATTTGDASVTNILTGGRWLVYSGDPRTDTTVAFKSSADFKQYNTNYGSALSDTTGNGFVYRFAPIITTSLSGTVSKAYDGNVTASIAGLTLNLKGGAIDGDVINLSALTSATYDNKNTGAGKVVSSNVLAVTSGSTGGTTVYGYQVSTATGSVGDITQRAITVTAVTDTKGFDGNSTSVGLPSITTGSIASGGDTASFTQTFDNKNAGTGKTLTASGIIDDGNGGNNYAVNYIADNTGVITEVVSDVDTDSPREAAGLGGVVANGMQVQNVTIIDLGATTAAGDVDEAAEACADDEANSANPNISVILNFGINLPEGVKADCRT